MEHVTSSRCLHFMAYVCMASLTDISKIMMPSMVLIAKACLSTIPITYDFSVETAYFKHIGINYFLLLY